MLTDTAEHAYITIEMMTHPVLFTHTNPKKIAVLGDNIELVKEVLKHKNLEEIYQEQPSLTISDARIRDINFQHMIKDSLDVIINPCEVSKTHLQKYFRLLNNDGILIQLSDSPFNLNLLINLKEKLHQIGFKDIQLLCFPELNFTTGWRTAFMALKKGIFKRVREKVVFNKSFKTQFYNFDIHRAAMVLPEFMRESLI